ncbi:ParA family protein [Streptomyces avicenniae]|uniref:ParA family protein n=1 Tax=Streptomyces avicenniae TaxID=500153 RepID=UPI00069BCD05|nr:ParA family protein [Streptomyces avicenniae]
MISIALFNSRGDVGTTTLVHHLAHMLSRRRVGVLAVDLDPQADLTALCMDEEQIEVAWGSAPGLADTVRPALRGPADAADAARVRPVSVRPGLWLLPGSPDLGGLEGLLADAWPASLGGDPAAVRATTAFQRTIARAANSVGADVVLLDVGRHLTAVNRAALLGARTVLTPLTPDLFSLRGLDSLGPTLAGWRRDWQQRVLPHIPPDLDVLGIPVPREVMTPLGYVVRRPEPRLDSRAGAYGRWLDRLPGAYADRLLGQQPPAAGDDDPYRIAVLRNYRTLLQLAHDARKPMFDLKTADGALGSTQKYVQTCYREFKELADSVVRRAEQVIAAH